MNRKTALELLQTRNAEGGEAEYFIGVGAESFDGGLVVRHLLPGAPAERAGLQEGDVLLGVNGRVFGSDPQAELGAAVVGPKPIVLKFRRGGDVKDVTVSPAAQQ